MSDVDHDDRPAFRPADHLSHADEAFLSAVSGRTDHIGLVVEREWEHHRATARALGVEPTARDADVPDPDAPQEHWEASARRIRSQTRELERQARARAVQLARTPTK